MKLLATCEDTGAFKLIEANHGVDTSKKDGLQPENVLNLVSEDHTRHSMVLQMVKNLKTDNIIVTRLDGSLECYKFLNEENDLKLLNQHKTVISPFIRGEQLEKFISLDCINGKIFAGSNKGQVFIWKDEESIVQVPIVYQLPLNEQEIEVMKFHPGEGDLIVIGGKDIDLTIFKLPSIKKQNNKDQPSLIFKGKNLHDKILDLKMKIHIKDIQILDDSNIDNFKLFTFTAFGEMRYYETLQGKKPRNNFKLVQKSIITTSLLSPNEVVISDEKAQVIKINTKTGDQICKFKGQYGTVETISNFKNKILAMGGLDRYVRAFYINNRECIVKVYLGTQVNNVIILEDEQLVEKPAKEEVKKIEEQKKKQAEEEAEEDDDEMWTKLETNIVQKRKRRKIVL